MNIKMFEGGEVNYYDNPKGYKQLLITYFIVHLVLEVIYAACRCKPMIFINIASILIYATLLYLNSKGKRLFALWAGISEILAHAALGSIFMGYDCGYFFWIVSLFTSLFCIFVFPRFDAVQRGLLIFYGSLFIVVFILLKVFSVLHVFTEKYHVPANVALVLFVSNAFLTMAATIFQYMLFEFRIASYDVKIKRLSDRDYLTGLYNRRCIQKVAEKAFEKDAAMYSEKAVAILDIDFFKQINDTYGHAAGDEVLIELSDILRSFSKEGITAGRWGGEEFVLIKDEKVAYKDFCASLEELRHTVEEHEFVYDSQTISVSVSIGAAAFDGEPTVDKLIQKADQRLYDAKGTGRNKVVC